MYACHCTVSAFDGVSTIKSRPTVIIHSEDEQISINEAKEHFIKQYENWGCSSISVIVNLIRKC